MTAPNLTGPTAVMNGLMLDADGNPVLAVRVDRDPQAEGDDDFDPETLTWSRADGDSTVVYEGPAIVRMANRSALTSDATLGEQTVAMVPWEGKLPLGSDIAPGDIVTIAVSQRDATLVGRSAVVESVLGSPFSVSKKWTALERVATVFGRGDQP